MRDAVVAVLVAVLLMQGFAAQWLESFKEFPPRQKPASFNLDDVMRKMSELGAKN